MNIEEMLKEGRMGIPGFFDIGKDHIGIRGMISTDSVTGRGIIEIIAWAMTPPSNPILVPAREMVGVHYRREINLESGFPADPHGHNYEISVHLDMGDEEIGQLLRTINSQGHPECSTQEPVWFVRYWKSMAEAGPAKWTFSHSDPQFIIHLTALHCFCWMKHDSPDFKRKIPLSHFNVRLSAYLNRCYRQMSAALMGQMY